MKTTPMKQQVEALRRLEGKRYYALFMEQGVGKALDVNTRVMTPTGWRRMGDLAVGDTVFAATGKPSFVTGVFPQGRLPVFKVSFNDRTSVRCSDDHLWAVTSNATRQAYLKGKRQSPFTVLPLSEFRNSLTTSSGWRCRYIPINRVLEFEYREPPIMPYTMGVLLGDGCFRRNHQCSLTNENEQVMETLKRELPVGIRITTQKGKGNQHSIVGGRAYFNALREFELWGKLSQEKFIPDVYKFNTPHVRLSLLRGLFDADAGVERSLLVYTSASERMANDVADIVRSLGGIARVSRKGNRGYKKEGVFHPCLDSFVVGVNLPAQFVPLTLERKLARYKPYTTYSPKAKVIVSVEPNGEDECVCISIADESKLYVVDGHTVTHNTWAVLADTERLYNADKIDSLVVVAPNGVHLNWTLREIPLHLEVPHIAHAWSTDMGIVAKRKLIETMLQPTKALRILAVSYDAICTKECFAFVLKFMQSTKCLYVLDESQYIKNHKAERTRAVFKLREASLARRICTGTPTDKPGDIFSQMEFLREGLLGTSSYRAFFAEYAQLCDAKNPTTDSDWAYRKQIKDNPRMAWAMVVARDDATGMPIYRNLDRLQKLIEPYSYRVLKEDCLDLPAKIYQSIYFELSPAQRKAYKLMEDRLRIELEDGSMTSVAALASLIKLQQITSGYVVVPGQEELLYINGNNARLDALKIAVEPLAGKSILVWARFREEIREVAQTLRDAGRKVVEYHGGISEKDRTAAVDALQNGDADTFVGNAAAGGIGLTLTAAEHTIYFSNDFSSLKRLQSEDRNHRIGTKNNVIYIDLVAVDTIDESITKALQWKASLAATIMGDRKLDVRVAAGALTNLNVV